jgi:hypothetical protein
MPDAPATPKPWTILQALETALQQITLANGYRTDIGTTVSMENTQDPEDTAEGITLFSLELVRPAIASNHNTAIRDREFTFVIEAATPCNTTNGVVPAHQRMHLIIEDIEQALTPVPGAAGSIPPQFAEVKFLDRPEGIPVVAAQIIMTARYRR